MFSVQHNLTSSGHTRITLHTRQYPRKASRAFRNTSQTQKTTCARARNMLIALPTAHPFVEHQMIFFFFCDSNPADTGRRDVREVGTRPWTVDKKDTTIEEMAGSSTRQVNASSVNKRNDEGLIQIFAFYYFSIKWISNDDHHYFKVVRMLTTESRLDR